MRFKRVLYVLARPFMIDVDQIQRDLGTAEPPPDAINPAHYREHPSGVECITVVEHLGFLRGNAIKYLWRAGSKSDELEDLRKARWYLDREISNIEARQG